MAFLLRRVVLFFRSYGKILVIAGVAGLVCGAVIFKALPQSYLSRLVLHSSILNNSEQIKIIDNWNELIKHQERAVLAAEFNCSPQIVARLGSLKAMDIEKLGGQNTIGFVVEMTVRDRDSMIMSNLRKGVVYGLENNEYVKVRVEQKRANLTELIEKVQTEIAKLDSTKKSIQSSFTDGKRNGASVIVDISGINKVMIELDEKLLQYREQLKFANAIFVLQYIEYATPVSYRLLTILAVGLASGLFMGFIICLFRIIKNALASVEPPAAGS